MRKNSRKYKTVVLPRAYDTFDNANRLDCEVSAARIWLRVGFRASALGWRRLRLDPGKMGTTSAACPLGIASLASPQGWLGFGGVLALGLAPRTPGQHQ